MNARCRTRRAHTILLAGGTLVLAAGMASAQQPARREHQGRPAPAGARNSQPQVASGERFSVADGGRTLHDNLLKVTWLLDANLGRSVCRNVPNVGTGGSMDWKTALVCVQQLNSGSGLLGHTTWQLPATPVRDSTCSAVGPQGNSFAQGCSGSGYGSLFYQAWKRHFGETVALQTGPTRGGFSNLQPTLYWFGNSLQQQSGGQKKNPYNGYSSFSFSNGWQGGNVNHHVMYLLPMIAGPVPADSPAAGATVWDPTAESGVPGKHGISWLADADVAHDQHFLRQVKADELKIRDDGSMDQETAQELIRRMRKYQYLGRNDWMAPQASATNCSMNGQSGTTAGYGCTASAMGHLYYDVFKLTAGSAVGEPPDIPEVKPFFSVQPSLYWACSAAPPTLFNPQSNLCNSTPTAASGFGFSFDMGSGFTDTTVLDSDLYVMVYYPDPPRACATPRECCMQAGGNWSGGRCR